MSEQTSEKTNKGEAASVPLLEVRGIVKRFGELLANDHIDLAIAQGEIHALLGENGAGKSTLVKILYGVLQPNAGEIRWHGRPVRIDSPAAARKLGIGMVFQHFSLFDVLTVAENISLALGDEFEIDNLSEAIRTVSRDYGLPLDPDAIIADLSVGERQRVEIVRCLLQEPRLVIMDEPTSVLTPLEADQLFKTLNRLAGEGVAILYISHRLDEVQRLCSRATVLRHGKVVASCDPRQETTVSLARMMVGSHVRAVEAAPLSDEHPIRLSLDRLSLPPEGPFSVPLKEISLDIRGGEVVAIAGVAGNGQRELFEALSGERPALRPGAIVIDDISVGKMGVIARRRLNAAFVPEERLGHAAVPGLTLSQNVVLTRHGDAGIVRRGFLIGARAKKIAERITEIFDVRKSHRDPEAGSLSGGNLQKFVVGREIDRKPGVFVVSQPTWGVDAGAAADIRQALVDLARSGSAVLVISQDLDEIFEIADRIAVISRGTLSTPVAAAEIDRGTIGLLMGGVGTAEDIHRDEAGTRENAA
ncbi:MAG: ABC transporter ATP-binding protein [Hyphomicrobiales bacterium]|nr:ABC transporter ATP-binding protein [Hyphomicrobiales bacterium]